MSELQRRYLEAMGIPLWQRRTPLPGVSDAAGPAPVGLAAGPVEAPVAGPSEPDSSAAAAFVEPSPHVGVPPAPESAAASDDDPFAELPPLDETDTWLPAAVDDDVFSSEAPQAPPAPPVDERAARIACMDWDALAREVSGCRTCGLCQTRTQTAFGVGDRKARWMIVGEAPGAEEDRQGEPFVGQAGQLLNLMLKAIGFERAEVFIANVIKCRPPNNRDPKPEEMAACEPFLDRQLALVEPDIVLVVGRIAAQRLLGSDAPVGKLRGRVHRFGPRQIPLVVTYHPAYLLRSPLEKRKAWDDLELALEAWAETRR